MSGNAQRFILRIKRKRANSHGSLKRPMLIIIGSKENKLIKRSRGNILAN